MKAFLFSFLLTTFSCLAADAPNDTTIVIGERVGAITPKMTLLGLKTIYGKNMKPAQLDGPEGTTLDGVKLFTGTDKELEIILEQVGDEKIVSAVSIIGKAWTFSNGLRADMTLEEVEKLNGKPFTISGFDWDYGGYANFEGGKLEAGVSIRFEPTTENRSEKLSGDVQIRSDDKALRAAKPKISGSISVMFPILDN